MQVSLFSENSSRWLVADQAIMMNGAADAVRDFFMPFFLPRGGDGSERAACPNLGRCKEMVVQIVGE
jgi:hypothetical protein